MSYDEDLMDSIDSLKNIIEEQTDQNCYSFPGNERSFARLLIDMTKSFEKQIIEMTEAIDDLNETMKRIEQIQAKALKWQEVFG